MNAPIRVAVASLGVDRTETNSKPAGFAWSMSGSRNCFRNVPFSFLFGFFAIPLRDRGTIGEERAIVRRMSNEHTEVTSFFTRYEAANAIFDVEQIAACYAEVFMFGGPAGVQCVKKEDFLKVLPRRKEFFRSRGLVSSNIDSLTATTLDSKYTLAKVVWNMRFDRSAGEPICSQNTASYILSVANDRFQIVFQIDHQDLTKTVQELGLE